MKKVVFFGSIGLAKKCLEEIILPLDVELIGVCCTPIKSEWRDDKSVYEFCCENNIPVLSFEEVAGKDLDIGISVRYDKIIPQEVINSFKQGIFNTHGGVLPEYRGSYCNINALINNEKEYGVTLHYITRGVDAGDVVAIKKVEIKDIDTGFSLYKTSERLCYEILKENIDSIVTDTNNRVTQEELIKSGRACNSYYARATTEKKYITLEKLEESLNIIKAFESPFHEPAYTIINNKKVYLKLN